MAIRHVVLLPSLVFSGQSGKERGLHQSSRKLAVCFEILQIQVVGECLGCRTYTEYVGECCQVCSECNGSESSLNNCLYKL